MDREMDTDHHRVLLRETGQLQKDAAVLSKRLEKAILGQPPLQEREIEQLRFSSADGSPSPAVIQNLLLRVRVFLKTAEGIALEAGALHEKISVMQKSLQETVRQDQPSGLQETARQDQPSGLQETARQDQPSGLQETARQDQQGVLQNRLSSLTVTSALLTRTQAQAQTIADSYRELERALVLAAKASGTGQAVRLQEAAVHARRLFAARNPGKDRILTEKNRILTEKEHIQTGKES